MKLNQTQLSNYLKTPSSTTSRDSFYWVNCEDGYLLQDALKKLRKYILHKGEYERIIFHIDNHCNWSEIKTYIQTPNLFSDQQLIELHFINKITSEQHSELTSIAKNIKTSNHATCIVIYPFRIESKVLQQKWMLTLDANSVIITLWPPSNAEYPNWLRQECIKYQIKIEDFDYFCQKTIGNPGVAVQTLYKLKLQEINIPTKDLLIKTLDQHANYTTFDLIDNYLLGNIKLCFTILKSLKYNDSPELLILWSLRKELILLAEILEKANASHQTPQKILQDYKLWAAKKNNLSRALQHLNLDSIYKSLHKISTIESLVKMENNPTFLWQEIEQLFLLGRNVELFNE